jgi:DNA/RNA-binding domain of Phe-tRNA-synthetase-like protein
MKLIIADDIVKMFPDLRIGIVVARDINNFGYSDEIEAIKQATVEAVRQNLSIENLSQHPYIAAWRETYRRFGTKPKEYRPTAEALLRRILRGEAIPTISKVVDLYLVVEAEFCLPIGGYDLDKIIGDIILRLSPGDEYFTPLGTPHAEERTYAGEIVYSDASKVLTRRWNYRDCDFAKITPESRNVALFCEAALSDIPTDHLVRCIQQLAVYLQRFCNGSIATHLIEARLKREQEL